MAMAGAAEVASSQSSRFMNQAGQVVLPRRLLVRLRRRCGQQLHKQLVEPVRIQIDLHFHRLHIELGLILIGPGESVSVAGAAIQIHIHVAVFFLCDQARIKPGCRLPVRPTDSYRIRAGAHTCRCIAPPASYRP